MRYGILSAKKIPLIGGLSIGLAFFLVSLGMLIFYRNLSREALAVIAGSALMLTFGILDDWQELSVLNKFSTQFISAMALVSLGIRTQISFFSIPLNIAITFIWVIGIINAFNHLDVADGVAAGCGAIVSLAFFVISALNGDTNTAFLSIILFAVILSFLLYNLPPAKVYLGNSGSHFLGFVLAATAIMVSYATSQRKIALLSPLLILGFPVFDTLFLIWVRLIKRKLPFKKSNDHLALRFLALGFSKAKALLAMLLCSLSFALSGVITSQASNFWGVIIILLVIPSTILLSKRMGRILVHG